MSPGRGVAGCFIVGIVMRPIKTFYNTLWPSENSTNGSLQRGQLKVPLLLPHLPLFLPPILLFLGIVLLSEMHNAIIRNILSGISISVENKCEYCEAHSQLNYHTHSRTHTQTHTQSGNPFSESCGTGGWGLSGRGWRDLRHPGGVT